LAARFPLINLLQDFGYVPLTPNTIGGTLWKDCNADGILDADETPRWQGIQIVLRDAAGNIVGATFTDANGNYRFTRLPNGTYTVDVNDVSNRLHGYWASVGAEPRRGQQQPEQALRGHAQRRPDEHDRRASATISAVRNWATTSGTTSTATACRTAASRAWRACG
jgi:hypothetical protein